MSQSVKITLYVVLAIGAGLFGYMATSQYRHLMDDSAQAAEARIERAGSVKGGGAVATSSGYGLMVVYGGVFIGMVIGLGLLFGHDLSHYVGGRTVKMLYDDEGEGVSEEYDQAEQEWANGNFLEAIRLMRDYLNAHEREQHVAIRIAEIYEKDMNNPLAAALEYEEVLKKNLTPERWGWTAIHLCNLYLKLNHQDKAIALLRRIDAEYGETVAAEKARKRLEEIDGNPMSAKGLAEGEGPGERVVPGDQSAPEPGRPKLPPGFSLKKK